MQWTNSRQQMGLTNKFELDDVFASFSFVNSTNPLVMLSTCRVTALTDS